MSPQILVLSPPRMGTQSIADALQHLGYERVYHMREVGKNGHAQQWTDLLHAKFGEEKQLDRSDFEPLLGDFDALADFPASIFVPELIAAYPEAKVILLQRDEDAWMHSMTNNLVHSGAPSENQGKSPMHAMKYAYRTYCWKNDLLAHGREYFREYSAKVKATAPNDRLLEFPMAGGWRPLCDFLGKDIPKIPYPNRDDHRAWKAEAQKRS